MCMCMLVIFPQIICPIKKLRKVHPGTQQPRVQRDLKYLNDTCIQEDDAIILSRNTLPSTIDIFVHMLKLVNFGKENYTGNVIAIMFS